jgi:hypothetical protein
MKKRKKPIIAILLLAVLFGIVAFMNKPVQNDASPEAPKAAKEAPQEDKKAVGGDVANQLKTDSKAKPKAPAPDARPRMPHGPGGPGGPGHEGMPSILRPKVAPQKPKPNDSSTSTQWYTNESARNVPGK